MAGAIVPVNSAAGGLLESLPNFAGITGLQASEIAATVLIDVY